MASHSRLIRSAAEGESGSVELRWSLFGRTIGIALSCSFSWTLRSLFRLRGGRRPRSRKAASRLSLLNAFGPEGRGDRRGTTDDEVYMRGLNFVVSLRIIVRGLDHGLCRAPCLVMGVMRNWNKGGMRGEAYLLLIGVSETVDELDGG